MTTKKKTKKVRVTRKFLMDLANRIYDPTTRRFLRLCKGVLQNGPDPTDKKRPMHCGLGELYFAMTGRQPEESTGVCEDDVIDLAVELSSLNGQFDRLRSEAIEKISSLNIPEAMKRDMISIVSDADEEDFAADVTKFRDLLDKIPTENDNDDCSQHSCIAADYRVRSRRVAKLLREAARLLPA